MNSAIRMEVSEYFDDSPEVQSRKALSEQPVLPLHREEEMSDVVTESNYRTTVLVADHGTAAERMGADSPAAKVPLDSGETAATVKTQKYTISFSVRIYNSQKNEWHSSAYLQFLFRHVKSVAAEVEPFVAEGFYIINDTGGQSDGFGKGAWPFQTDRIYVPLSAITFLYDDDESDDLQSQRCRMRPFCGSLSAGLFPSLHPSERRVLDALGNQSANEVVSLLYLPSMLTAPPHEVASDGSVVQQEEVSPWEVVTGTPLVDPSEERPLLIHCGTPEGKVEIHRKLIEALQSHYEPMRPGIDMTGRSRSNGGSDEAFDKRTFYRHCMRRVYHMHFLRRLLLLGAMKDPGMYQTLWSRQENDECMKQLLQQHSVTGTLENLLIRIRTLVSLKKVRFMENGFNLDLAAITPNIIAMGFPSTGSQALMRNPLDDVLRYFEVYWSSGVWPVTKQSIEAYINKDEAAFVRRDQEAIAAFLGSTVSPRFRVYNLCSERCYRPTRFMGSFERFPSDDHNPPPLAQMLACCCSAEAFLKGNDTKDADHFGAPTAAERVVAIHCKAGKGRTGVMIVALMLFMKLFDSLDAALKHYNVKRTRDGKGITIASQIRFLRYFSHSLSQIGRSLPAKRPIRLRALSFSPIPWFDMDGGCTPFFQVRARVIDHTHFPLGQREILSTEDDTMEVLYDSRYLNGTDGPKDMLPSFVGSERASFRMARELELIDEVQLLFFNKGSRLLRTEYMFSFWIHTSFLDERSGVVIFGKDEIDGASKEHREFFDPGFLVEVEYTTLLS